MQVQQNHSKGIAFAMITVVLWGFLPIAIKVVTYQIDTVSIAWLRFVVAFTVLLSLFVAFNPSGLKILLKPPKLLFLGALGLSLNYVGAVKGIKFTSPSNMQVLMQLAPMMLIVAGILIFKETISRIQLLGMALAFVGFSLFYGEQISSFLNTHENLYLGIGWVIAGAIGWTIYAVCQKVLVKHFDAQTLNLLIYGVPIFILLPLGDLSTLQGLSAGMWALLVFLGLNTLVAYGALTEALKYTDANKIGVLITLNPLITLFTMQILAHYEVSWIENEKVEWMGFIGAFCVVSGAVLAVRKQKQES